jgi:histidine phosphotransferase ChpT
MVIDHLTFSQMLCSRLCHDLITPVGAIYNGFEILKDCEQSEQEDLIEVTRRSAETASRRLSFYRAAFGYSIVSPYPSFLSIKQLMEGFLEPLKIQLHWTLTPNLEENQELKQHFNVWARLLINLVITGSEALPYGGQIHILYEPKNLQIPVFKLQFKGDFVALRPEVIKALGQELPDQEFSPLVIQAIFTKLLAHQEKICLTPQAISAQELLFSLAPYNA